MTIATQIHPTIIDALKAAAVKLAQIYLATELESTSTTDHPPKKLVRIDPALMAKTEKVPAKFASPGDIPKRHVTMNISDLVRQGFFAKKHKLVQGDQIETEVNGIYTVWKVNRRNARTIAAKLHPDLELPRIDNEGYHKVLYDIEVKGIIPIEDFA